MRGNLIVLCALTGVAVTVTACTGGGSDNAAQGSTLPTTSTSSATSPAPPIISGTSRVPSPTKTSSAASSGGGSSSTPTPLGSTLIGGGGNGPAKPTPMKPAPAGTYTYSVTGTSSGKATLKVAPPVGTKQTATFTSPIGSSTETLDYRSDGVYFIDLDITQNVPFCAFHQDLKPVNGPVRVFRTGAQPGEYVIFKVVGQTSSATVQFSVFGSTSVVVAGKTLPSFRVRYSSTDLTGTACGYHFHDAGIDADLWLAPGNGLPYKQENHTTVPGAVSGQPISSHTVAVLTAVPQ